MKYFNSSVPFTSSITVSSPVDGYFPGEVVKAVHSVLDIPVRNKLYNYLFDFLYGSVSDSVQAENYLEKRLTPAEIVQLGSLRAWFHNVDRGNPANVGGHFVLANLTTGLILVITHEDEDSL